MVLALRSKHFAFLYICPVQSFKEISSVQNSLVKKVVLLKEKSRERKKTGLFIVEGLRELQLALRANFEIECVLFQPQLCEEKRLEQLLSKTGTSAEIITVTNEVYLKMAHRGTTEGVLAIAKTRSHTLDTFVLKTKNPLILVAEAPEKPGNIGAFLRTADAANLDGVIIANPKTDLYNPNIIRSSVGCVFTNNLAMGSTEEILGFLKQNNIKIYCAALTASINYLNADFKGANAIVVGTEATGLSKSWLDQSHQNIIIPMEGEIDSMNVSVSAGILIFEAKRQRT